MPSLIPVDLYRDKIAPLLGPGEQPLVAEAVQEALGVDRIERAPEERLAALPAPLRTVFEQAVRGASPVDTRSTLERVIDATIFPVIDLDPMLGVAGHGQVGSFAHAFQRGLQRGSAPFLLATSHRLLLVSQNVNEPWTRLVGVPRAAIVSAQSRPHVFQRGRFVVGFVDASEIAFLTGLLFSGAARRLAGALVRPG